MSDATAKLAAAVAAAAGFARPVDISGGPRHQFMAQAQCPACGWETVHAFAGDRVFSLDSAQSDADAHNADTHPVAVEREAADS